MKRDEKIHEFVNRLEGSLKNVASDKSSELYKLWEEDYYRELFYDKLKLVGGAFTVLEAFSNQPLLLFRKDYNRNQDVISSDFFWFPYEAKYFSKEDAETIDRLFLTTRESQKLSENAPDFLRFIRDTKYPFAFLTNVKHPYEFGPIIYCDNSEILIFLLCYLETIERIKESGYEEMIYSKDSPENISILNNDGSKIDVLARTFSEYSDKKTKILNTKLFQSLGLLDFANKKTGLFGRLKTRSAQIAASEPIRRLISNTNNFELRDPGDIQKFIGVLLDKVFEITDYSSYADSLQKIHTTARFPMLPYLEIFLKRNVKVGIAHFVLPVWKSFAFAPDVYDGPNKGDNYKEENVVLALLTINDDYYNDKGFRAAISTLAQVFHQLDQITTDKQNKFSILAGIMRRLGHVTADTVFYQKFAVKKIQEQATKAAISQVMARNMSHNLGSHVMNRLTDGRALGELDVDKFTCYIPQATSNLSDEEKSGFYQLAYFNNYIKSRMDYLSDVTFGTPVMHTNKKVFSDLYKDFDKVRLLLEHISGLDKFKFEVVFMINNVPMSDNEDLDFSIAIPNDLLGSQAFYNIIENVIRNTAKHNQEKDEETTTVFTVNFKDIESCGFDHTGHNQHLDSAFLYFEVEIFDNEKVLGERCLSQEERAQYFVDTKQYYLDYVKNIDWLVYNQNKKLNQAVLQENYQLRTSSLGLLEMEASAAYLRKLDITDIGSPENDIDYSSDIHHQTQGNLGILKAFNKNGCLGYRFFVNKPTEFLIISDAYLDATVLEDLAKDGVWVRSAKEFLADLEKGFVYNHQFVLHESGLNLEAVFHKYKTSLPLRFLEVDDIRELVESDYSFNKVEEWVWEQWYENIRGDFGQINIFTSYGADSEQSKINAFNLALTHHTDDWPDNINHYKYNRVHYLEALSSNAQSRLPKFGGDLHDYCFAVRNDKTTKRKLFDAAIAKVVVIDERVQRFAQKTYIGLTTNNEIYEKTNVFLPDLSKVNLGADNYTRNVTETIAQYIEDNINDSAFLLVHYSILERMYVDRDKVLRKLIEWSQKTNVVVTSGRGKPAELPKEYVRFINLSPVLNVFTDTRSKYSINYLLNAARK